MEATRSPDSQQSGTMTEKAEGNAVRGFAAMDQSRQREIARKGGRAAHQKGTAHEFTSQEARTAGQKGGQRVSANREHMSKIGRIGGKKSAGRRQEMRSKGENDRPSISPTAHPGQTPASDSHQQGAQA